MTNVSNQPSNNISDNSGGGTNMAKMPMPSGNDATIIKGWRLPQRDWRLSEKEATSGSVTASKTMATASTTEI